MVASSTFEVQCSRQKAPRSTSAFSDLETETLSTELAVETIRSRWHCETKTAVILGTGLGELADEVAAEATISYRDIPGFPRSTALAHKGRLVCGELGGVPVVVLQGRCHVYEGYSLESLTFPVRVLAALGIETLVVTNAAGGLNPSYCVGDVMLIDDHINLMRLCPQWRHVGGAARGPHFYDRELAARAEAIARRADFALRRGVYVGVTGPTYETRAEYRAFRRIGGDAVGMSTIPEVLVAASRGLRVLGLSTITNIARPDAPQIVSADEVVAVAELALPRVRTIVRELIAPGTISNGAGSVLASPQAAAL